MNPAYKIRVRRRGLGAPILPDNFTTAAGSSFSFSPGTPDATIMQILQQNQQQLPADLAAAWASGQAPAPSGSAVTPAGSSVSTQTGVVNNSPLATSLNVSPGVWLWTRQDGTSFFGDVSGRPISYTPPAPAPATTPAASPAPSPVVPQNVVTTGPANPQVFLGPPVHVVTPSGVVLSSTTGSPAPAPAPASAAANSGIASWLQGSMIGGVPNWILLVGGAFGLYLFTDSEGGRHR